MEPINEDLPKISDAEYRVMQILWAHNRPLLASDVTKSLCSVTDWQPETVKTMIKRLHKKGVLGATPKGKSYLYFSRVLQSDYVKQESKAFVDRVFAGSPMPMLSHFVDKHMSKQDIEALKQLLDSKLSLTDTGLSQSVNRHSTKPKSNTWSKLDTLGIDNK